jgi:hypothetical protein
LIQFYFNEQNACVIINMQVSSHIGFERNMLTIENRHYSLVWRIFRDVHGLIQFSEKMAASIREEIRRLHRRKQLNFYPGHEVHCNQESSSDGAMDSPGSPTTSSFATTYSSNTKEKPLFTFRQVINNFCLV